MFNNQLFDLPASFAELTSLKDVNVGSNQLRSLPDISRWTAVTRLAVQMNPMGSLPDLSPMASTLTQLQFNSCPVRAWPVMGTSPAGALTNIDASKSEIASIPEGAFALLPAVTALNLSGTPLTALPSDLGECVALETLNLGNCKLESLPASIGRCKALKALVAMGNRFVTLPAELSECSAITRCVIDKCPTFDTSDAGTLTALRAARDKCRAAGKDGLFRVDAAVTGKL